MFVKFCSRQEHYRSLGRQGEGSRSRQSAAPYVLQQLAEWLSQYSGTEGVIVRDVMRTASIVNLDAYFNTLEKTRKCCQRVRPDRNLREMSL